MFVKKEHEYNMENVYNNDGTVYDFKRGMGNSSDMGLPFNKKPTGQKGDVRNTGIDNIGNNILTHTRKKMAQIKLTWALFHLLGLPCFLISIVPPKWLRLLDINVGTIEQPYRMILYILAIVYAITVVARSLEKWHHSHLTNKEHRRRLREEFNQHHPAHGQSNH
jgi:hypothetical protein